MRRQLNYSSVCAAEDKSQIGYAPLAQLDRALVYGTKGWGFDSLRARQAGIKRTLKIQGSFFSLQKIALE